MNKLSSADELQAELRKLLAYAGTPSPSRKVLARDLTTLAGRLAGKEPESMTAEDLEKRVETLRKLEAFTSAALALDRAWGDDNNYDPATYPKGLPSFDEFVHEVMDWRDSLKDEVRANTRR